MNNRTAQPKRTYALIVGVETYHPDIQLLELDGPAHDAWAFTRWLLGRGVPIENIFLFISPLDRNKHLKEQSGPSVKPATHQEIRDTITDVLSRKDGDLLYIFWGGHGVIALNDSHRLFYADAKRSDKKNLDVQSLLMYLRSDDITGFPLQIVIVDACANYQSDARWALPDGSFTPSILTVPAMHHEQFVLFGAGPREFAQNSTERQTGIFSEAVREELAQEPNNSWPPDMEQVMARLVEKFAELRRKKLVQQTPMYSWYQDWMGNKRFSGQIDMVAASGSKQGTAVILTALPVEYEAVYAHGAHWQEQECNNTLYERGIFSTEAWTWHVIIAQLGGPGNVGAALEVERAITCFHPDVVFSVGVAGGIKDVKIGDVVLATKVYGYESGKETEQQFFSRPDVGETSHRLIQYAQSVARNNDWMSKIEGGIAKRRTPPRVFVGPIASGEKVIASVRSNPAQLLHLVYNDTLAVEMEARGVLKAIHANGNVPALIIRGISDRLDGKTAADASGSQRRAARHASAFAFEVLARLNPATFLPPRPVNAYSSPNEAGPLDDSSSLLPGQKTQPSKVSNVLYRRNPLFTGREKLLGLLHEKLATKQPAALTQAQAINGLGGIGKTQVAVEYAYRYEKEYHVVSWVRAATRESIISDYVNLASLLHLPVQNVKDPSIVVAVVKEWLTSHPDWLLILDNVDDLGLVHEFLPPQNTGHVLLTTRLQAIGTLANAIAVDKMPSDEGILLLLRRAKLLSPVTPLEIAAQEDRERAKAIVEALDGLPLALDQAGAYVEDTGCSLSDYLALYQERRLALLSRRSLSSFDYPETVASTWSLSFQRVEQASPAAADLLRLCAFLDPDAIHEAIITEGARELGPVLEPVAADPLLLNEAIQVLRRYSLVKRDPEEKILNLHRLVQVVLKDGLAEAMQQQWAERAVRAVNVVFPQVTQMSYETWTLAQRYLPQVEVCASLIEHYHLWFPGAARLLHQAGWYLRETAQYVQSEHLLQLSLTIYKETVGAQHPDVADTLNHLALLYHVQGRFSEAEPLYQEASAIREKVLGPEHFETAKGLNNLGEFYRAQGRYSEAEPLYQRSLAIREKVLEPDARQTAIVLHNLARTSYARGQYAKAEALYQRAQMIYEQRLKPDHPEIAAILDHLARLYYVQGEYDKAEPLMLRAITIRQEVLGPKHPHLAQSLCGLAKIYCAQGRYTEAEPLLQQALAICEERHGPKHHSTLLMLENLAELYRLQGRFSAAEPLYPRIRDIYGSLSLSAMIALKEHEPLYQQVLATYAQVPGPDDPAIATILETYAARLQQVGRIQEAAIFDTRAKVIRAKSSQQ